MGIWQQRDALMRGIRTFFQERDFTEVDTPIRMQTPCMELHIDAEKSGNCFLRTSPEIFHKKLLAAGHERIFEIGKCFRHGERGPMHNPEYTMLEWYRAHADYMDVLDDTQKLIASVWQGPDLTWQVFFVSEVFEEFAGWNPAGNFDEDRFDIDLVEKIEPALKQMGGAVVLRDYPIEAAALSRRKPGHPLLAERWELYIDGVELANAYSELTDPDEQRRRFEEWAVKRNALGREVYGIDAEFIDAVGRMPPSGGVALGVDRLLLIMTGMSSLDQVLPFR
jgi:lysyl-tRNA synthetase class 2